MLQTWSQYSSSLPTQGINGVVDLLKAVVHKYKTPSTLMHIYLALYTVSTLRLDPEYFQIAWGLRLAGAIVGGRLTRYAKGFIDSFYGASEFVFRFSQLLELERLAKVCSGRSSGGQLWCVCVCV